MCAAVMQPTWYNYNPHSNTSTPTPVCQDGQYVLQPTTQQQAASAAQQSYHALGTNNASPSPSPDYHHLAQQPGVSADTLVTAAAAQYQYTTQQHPPSHPSAAAYSGHHQHHYSSQSSPSNKMLTPTSAVRRSYHMQRGSADFLANAPSPHHLISTDTSTNGGSPAISTRAIGPVNSADYHSMLESSGGNNPFEHSPNGSPVLRAFNFSPVVSAPASVNASPSSNMLANSSSRNPAHISNLQQASSNGLIAPQSQPQRFSPRQQSQHNAQIAHNNYNALVQQQQIALQQQQQQAAQQMSSAQLYAAAAAQQAQTAAQQQAYMTSAYQPQSPAMIAGAPAIAAPSAVTAATQPSILGGKYRLERRIGSGSFGEIFCAVHVSSSQEVAVKLEPTKSRHAQLAYEYRIYRILASSTTSASSSSAPTQSIGIPRVYYYGSEGLYNVLVMELLGPSLEDLFSYCNRQFTVKTVCMLAEQLLSRIEFIHNRNFIHRDIKPDNFLVGVKNSSSGGQANVDTSSLVYAIDFGLAKKYRSNNQHIAYVEDRELIGTVRYASLNAHLGIEQSRRDDLESLGNMLLYFLRGSLPWQGMRATGKKEKYRKISQKKMMTTADMLCAGFDIEFSQYLSYCRALKFDQPPDYDYCKSLFRAVMAKHQWQYDWRYDWVILQEQASVLNYTTGGKPANMAAVPMTAAPQAAMPMTTQQYIPHQAGTPTAQATVTPAPLASLAPHHQAYSKQHYATMPAAHAAHYQY